MEHSERSWRNLAIVVGLGAMASVGTGALASVSLEMMMGGSSLDGVYQRLEARQPAVATTESQRFASVSKFSGSVPEPTTWALMVVGVGAVGAKLRTGRPEAEV
ncbi:MAG: PEPxxWA-CTERM sorting domain-containing protein [Caulobacteraceae bacterium]|nr:PEPxxWA-CTERM sorting domain-containing protein [Caulobacteraceae bacterium]